MLVPPASLRSGTVSHGATADYIFETIEVPGVDFLELTSTNDLGHYAGNTRSPDGEKIVGFTLIDAGLFHL